MEKRILVFYYKTSFKSKKKYGNTFLYTCHRSNDIVSLTCVLAEQFTVAGLLTTAKRRGAPMKLSRRYRVISLRNKPTKMPNFLLHFNWTSFDFNIPFLVSDLGKIIRNLQRARVHVLYIPHVFELDFHLSDYEKKIVDLSSYRHKILKTDPFHLHILHSSASAHLILL